MRHKWLRFQRMSWSEKVLLLRAAALLIVCSLGLSAAGLKRTLRWSQPRRPDGDCHEPLAADAAGIIRAVDRAGNLTGIRRCLTRALVARRLLGLHGFPAGVRLGVRREGRAIRAHAWVNPAATPGEPLPSPGYNAFEHDF